MLDFEEDYAQHFTDIGYSVFAGHSGLASKPFSLPRHESEIEIILWDTSIPLKEQIVTADDKALDLHSLQGQEFLTQVAEILARYCKRVRDKGGFVGIFLGDLKTEVTKRLSIILGTGLSLNPRVTSTMKLHARSDNDPWYEFFKRFVLDKNIRYAIRLFDAYTTARYFHDEDKNWYAVTSRHFALIPKIEPDRKKEAITLLLQDVLPFVCTGWPAPGLDDTRLS